MSRSDRFHRSVGIWRVAARLARREVRRRPWRTALVALLVGLPVAGVASAAIVFRTTEQPPLEESTVLWGQADDLVQAGRVDIDTGPVDEGTLAAVVRQAYPEGSRALVVTTAPEGVTDRHGRLHGVERSNQPVDDPLLRGVVELTGGRAPQEPDEVAVTPSVAEETGAGVGDRLDLLRGDDLTVTGIVTFPNERNQLRVVGPTPPPDHPDLRRIALVDMPPGATGVDDAPLDAVGASSTRAWIDAPIAQRDHLLRRKLAVAYVVGGVVLAVAGLVVSAAFAVGARRQLRTLGLLAAFGASPTALRRTVLLQGTTTGLLGSLVGVGLAVAGTTAAHPWLEDIHGRTLPGPQILPLDLLAAVALGAVASTVAAWFPARSASRVPVLTALAGRRPAGASPRVVPLVGAVVVAGAVVALGDWHRRPDPPWPAGLALALAVLFGATAITPWVVARTEPLAARLRGAARIAARDLARQRLRSAAVVAAVMAPAGLSVIAAVDLATSDARDAAQGSWLRDDEVLVDFQGGFDEGGTDMARAVGGVLPEARQVALRTAQPQAVDLPLGATVDFVEPGTEPPPASAGGGGTSSWPLTVVEPQELIALGASRQAVADLTAGKLVVTRRMPVGDAHVFGTEVVVRGGDVVRHAVRVPHLGNTRSVLVSPATVEGWGLRVVPDAVLFRTPEPLTRGQAREVRGRRDDQCGWYLDRGCDGGEVLRSYLLGGGSLDYTEVSLGVDDGLSADLLGLAMAGGSLLFTLAVVTVALALTAAESRDERALLGAVGAGPRTRRGIVAWQALLLPAMALALATPIALAVGWVLQSSQDHVTSVGPQVPWSTLAALVVGLPLATAGATWLGATLTGRRQGDLSTVALATD